MADALISIGGGAPVDPATLTLPPDREFRDAWQLTGAVVAVDTAVAREIQRERIRQERNGRFDPFDKDATPLTRKAAVGTPLTPEERARLQAAEAAAQNLRDSPADPRIDAAATPAALAALTLDVLTT